jgi:hypothetical protein
MFSIAPFSTRVNQLHQLGDGVGYDQLAFSELKMLHIAAPSAKKADHTHFLQDWPQTFALVLRAISIHAHTGENSTSQVHNIVPYGDYCWNPTYAIYLHEGLVAFKEQDNTHNNDAGKTVLGYTTTANNQAQSPRSKVELVSSGDGSGAALDAQKTAVYWLRHNSNSLTNEVEFDNDDNTDFQFQVWDSGTTDFAQNSPSDNTWYYISDVQFTDNSDDNSSNNVVDVFLEPGTPYPHEVAEGFHEEPYHYAPGYSMVRKLTIEQQGSDRLFETNGDVSYFLNQVHRPIEAKEEDQRLCNTYVDEMHDQQFRDPLDHHNLLHPRERAQRQSRMPQATFSALWNPFKDNKTAIPLAVVFGRHITFKGDFREPHEILVYPKKSKFGPDQTYVRPKTSNGREADNESIRRNDVKPKKAYNDQGTNSFSVRLEVFLASVDEEEERQIDGANIYNVCQQPQIYSDEISTDKHDSNGGDKVVDHEFSRPVQGYISQFIFVTRQRERMKDRKFMDLRSKVDEVQQLPQAATYTVSFSYDKQARSVMRHDNQGTSDLQHRFFHKTMPEFGTEGALHVVSAATHPSEKDYTGVFFPSKTRITNFNLRVPNSAFKYTDDEGNTKTSALHVMVIANQFQILLFSPGSSQRVHNISDVTAPY